MPAERNRLWNKAGEELEGGGSLDADKQMCSIPTAFWWPERELPKAAVQILGDAAGSSSLGNEKFWTLQGPPWSAMNPSAMK